MTDEWKTQPSNLEDLKTPSSQRHRSLFQQAPRADMRFVHLDVKQWLEGNDAIITYWTMSNHETILGPMTEPPERSGDGRTRRMLDGAFATALSKGVVLVVNAISLPIMVRYLGAEAFGVWTTITSLLAMLLLLDLGVANSMTNLISEAFAQDNQETANVYVTNALAIMVAFSIFLAGIAWSIWPRLHWDTLFHLSSSVESPIVSHAAAGALAVFLVGLPAGLAPKILGAYQDLRVASMFTAVGSLCNLVSLIALVHLHAGLSALVVASSAAFVGANLLCLIWTCFFFKPWLAPRVTTFKRSVVRTMMKSGGDFFILQLAALLAFNIDNLVVTHYLGPAEVVPYSVAWRLCNYAIVAQALISPSLWPAFSEAFVRNDFAWIRSTFRRTMVVTMGVSFAFCILCSIAGRLIIRIWASKAAVPSEELLLLMCLWVLLSTFMNNTVLVVLARGKTRVQAWLSLAAAALNVWLSVVLVQKMGSTGVILATIISYLLVLVVPQTFTCYRILYQRVDDPAVAS